MCGAESGDGPVTIKILVGDCRDILKTLPNNSVHMVCTSPPYWGLRDYQVPPSIWIDDEGACEHEWGEELRANGRGHPSELSTLVGTQTAPIMKAATAQGSFCCRCGAWRGAHGLEPSYQLFVDHEVLIFREVRRVLRNDGTLWLNLGDSFATGAGKVGERPGGGAQGDAWNGYRGSRGGSAKQPYTGHAIGPMTQPNRLPQQGLKPKDLCGIPWRVAFALQADGWYLRQWMPWIKRNPMPESTTDRPSSACETIFLLTKNGGTPLLWRHAQTRAWVYEQPEPDYLWRHRETREESREPRDGDDWARINLWKGADYFYDYDAVKRPFASGPSDLKKMAESADRIGGKHKTLDDPLSKASAATKIGRKRSVGNKQDAMAALSNPATERRMGGFNDRWDESEDNGTAPKERAFRNSDFFFDSLGALTDDDGEIIAFDVPTQPFRGEHFATFPTRLIEPTILAGCPQGGTILDPFGGAGTTGLVADRLGRDAIIIELNPKYADMAEQRIRRGAGMFSDVSMETVA